MFKSVFTILIFLIFISAAYAQQPDPNFTDKIAFQDRAKFLLKSGFKESQNYSDFDLVYQRMEWEINPNVRYIKGNVASYFTSQIENLTEIEFDLNDTMRVDSVIQHKQKIEFTHEENKLMIKLAKPLTKLQFDSLQVYYQGEPGNTGFEAFANGVHSGIPIIWTLSEPYGAMEWWPCKQSLLDKIDSIDVIVISLDSFITASNGILISDKVENGLRKMHWKHRHPIATYLVAIATTNYATYSDWLDLEDGRKIEILNFVYPENLEKAKGETPVTSEFIQLYNQLIGEYPFANEKYGHAQFGWGGGMEHQTMSFMYNFNYELVAHELAHQWFGDYITCRSWHDIWLNEGFATFLTGLVYENLQDGYWYPNWKKTNLTRIISKTDGSVYVKDTTDINTIFSSRLSYSKGAYLLHMLRWIIGDNNFFQGMKSYFNDPEIAHGFASTNQFIKHMETAGDTILAEFLNDWFYGEGYPVYSAEFTPVNEGLLKISLSQTQSNSSVNFFEMPVPVRLYNAENKDSIDFRLDNTTNYQEFIVNVDFPVSKLKIDPDLWLISKTSKIVNVIDNPSINKIFVYPNPFNKSFSIQIPTGQQLISLEIFSTEGKRLKQYFENNTNFYRPEVAKGMYILKVKTTGGNFEQKIVKQ